MDLMGFGFQNSNLFEHMPLFDEISYIGVNEEKVRRYKAIREDQACELLALSFIRQDEKMLWGATEDFLKRSVISAASNVQFRCRSKTASWRVISIVLRRKP